MPIFRPGPFSHPIIGSPVARLFCLAFRASVWIRTYERFRRTPPGRPHTAVTTSATWERHRQPYLTRYSNARIMIRHKGRSTGQLWEHKGNAGSLRIINSLLPNWGFGSCRLIDARPAAVTSLLIFRNRVFFAAPGPLADCITMREDLVRPHQSSTVRRTTILSSSATQRQNE